MEKLRNLILDVFDIGRLKTKCNHHLCTSKSEKEVFIYEYTTQRKIGIASLYVCEKHLIDANNIVKKIKIISPDMIIQHAIGNVAQNRKYLRLAKPGRAHT